GVLTLLVPVLRAIVISVTLHLGLKVGVLAAATVLFFPALAALGTLSPIAIRLQARNVEEVGGVAGKLYAISTVGSFVGALATGFFLVPSLAVSRCFLVVGGGLVATAIALGRRQLARRDAAVLGIVGIASLAPHVIGTASGAILVDRQTSAY